MKIYNLTTQTWDNKHIFGCLYYNKRQLYLTSKGKVTEVETEVILPTSSSRKPTVIAFKAITVSNLPLLFKTYAREKEWWVVDCAVSQRKTYKGIYTPILKRLHTLGAIHIQEDSFYDNL